MKVIKKAFLASEIEGTELTKKSLEEQILKTKPVNIQDLVAKVPKVLWEEVGGYETVKL